MEYGKYISEKHRIGNCPFCRGVVFRDFSIKPGNVSFVMRCPHCQKNFRVIIDSYKITFEKTKEE